MLNIQLKKISGNFFFSLIPTLGHFSETNKGIMLPVLLIFFPIRQTKLPAIVGAALFRILLGA